MLVKKLLLILSAIFTVHACTGCANKLPTPPYGEPIDITTVGSTVSFVVEIKEAGNYVVGLSIFHINPDEDHQSSELRKGDVVMDYVNQLFKQEYDLSFNIKPINHNSAEINLRFDSKQMRIEYASRGMETLKNKKIEFKDTFAFIKFPLTEGVYQISATNNTALDFLKHERTHAIIHKRHQGK